MRGVLQGMKENKIAILILIVVGLITIGSCVYGLSTE